LTGRGHGSHAQSSKVSSEPVPMMDFELARTYDVVTCLFSAIGIARTFERLERAPLVGSAKVFGARTCSSALCASGREYNFPRLHTS
jgi:hypothetical protein